MDILQSITRLWHREPALQADPVAPSKATIDKQQSIISRHAVEEGQVVLGVKYVSRFAFQLSPPAGWRKSENQSSCAWPAAGLSPSVSFTNNNLPAGQQAIIKWQLLGTAESTFGHQLLQEIFHRQTITLDEASKIEAPGVVPGNRVNQAEVVTLPTGQPAVLLFTRLDQCRGEDPIFRYIFVLPDRKLNLGGQTLYYRESIQFAATESVFWLNEAEAVSSIKSFRRYDERTDSGSFASLPSSLQTVR